MPKEDENLPGNEENLEDGSDDTSTDEEENTSTEEDGGEDTETEMDLPTAKAKLEDAQRHIRKVNRESANRRHEIVDLKDKLAQYAKTGDDATEQLSTLQAQLSAVETELTVLRMRDKFDAVVSKAKIAFVNLTAQHDAFGFAKEALQELTEEATDEDYLDIIKDVVKSRPYLRVKLKPKDINSAKKGASKEVPGIDMEEIKTTFGIKS